MAGKKAKLTGAGRIALAKVKKLYPKVMKVVDADEKVVITVTEKDGNTGHQLDLTECALAIACKRQLGLQGAIIGLGTSYLVRGTVATRYKTGQSITREITSFDRHKDFKPGVYTLVPYPTKAHLGAYETSTKGHATGKNPRYAARHVTTGVRSS